MFYSSCFCQHSMLSESTKSESLVIHNNSNHITLYAYTVKDNFTNSWTTKFFFVKDIFVTHRECSLYMQTFYSLPTLSVLLFQIQFQILLSWQKSPEEKPPNSNAMYKKRYEDQKHKVCIKGRLK